jgi:hypothetical protein
MLDSVFGEATLLPKLPLSFFFSSSLFRSGYGNLSGALGSKKLAGWQGSLSAPI